jgi:hypothetical protein
LICYCSVKVLIHNGFEGEGSRLALVAASDDAAHGDLRIGIHLCRQAQRDKGSAAEDATAPAGIQRRLTIG